MFQQINQAVIVFFKAELRYALPFSRNAAIMCNKMLSAGRVTQTRRFNLPSSEFLIGSIISRNSQKVFHVVAYKTFSFVHAEGVRSVKVCTKYRARNLELLPLGRPRHVPPRLLNPSFARNPKVLLRREII